MRGLYTLGLAALFVYLNVHGAAMGLVQLARSSDGSLPVVADDDLGGGHDPMDPSDGPPEPEEESPRSGADEDDVKHCSTFEPLTLVDSEPRVASLHGEELAHEHVHLEDLERPPRA